ncbi:hypothetical protein BWQ92_00315 [Arthrobacter sp. QXT-31]|nr:hypothetical protein BWQ92_00315 [Arthrobacter sp. QXT-31]
MDSSSPLPRPVPTEITPLEERAVLRFQYDLDFHKRVQAAAEELLAEHPDDPLYIRLPDAMRSLQQQDEAVVSDDQITAGTRYLADILGLPYAVIQDKEREGLKAGVHGLLAAVNGASA